MKQAIPERLFIHQETLDEWSEQNKVSLQNDQMQIFETQTRHKLIPAYLFDSIVSQEKDPHGLVGKVLTTAALEEMEAEPYMDSVIYGEDAYEVFSGFLALRIPDNEGD